MDHTFVVCLDLNLPISLKCSDIKVDDLACLRMRSPILSVIIPLQFLLLSLAFVCTYYKFSFCTLRLKTQNGREAVETCFQKSQLLLFFLNL